MWLLRFRWLGITAPCSAEGTRSRLRLTGEPREWYARIQENLPLIWHEGGTRSRWTIFGSEAEQIHRSKSIGQPDSASKRPKFVASRNNSG